MHRAKTIASMVSSRVSFFLTATKLRHLNELNNMGEILEGSWCSERSLDEIFEQGEVTNLVIEKIVNHYDSDLGFAEAFDQQWGNDQIDAWRQTSGDMFQRPPELRPRQPIQLGLETEPQAALGF